jgi:endonuclease/exonuclease/phosphatase family metal-dependent hydrolase
MIGSGMFKKNIIKNFLSRLLILLALSAQQLSAEIIVYKQVKKSPHSVSGFEYNHADWDHVTNTCDSNEKISYEWNQIYLILDKYQWPTCLAHVFSDKEKKSLFQEESSSSAANSSREFQFIKEKLFKVTSKIKKDIERDLNRYRGTIKESIEDVSANINNFDIKCCWVPTSFYELCALEEFINYTGNDQLAAIEFIGKSCINYLLKGDQRYFNRLTNKQLSSFYNGTVFSLNAIQLGFASIYYPDYFEKYFNQKVHEYIKKPESSLQGLDEMYKFINQALTIKHAACYLNNKIVEILKGINFFDKTTDEQRELIKAEVKNKIAAILSKEDLLKKVAPFHGAMAYLRNDYKDSFDAFIDLEYQAYMENKCILFRGAGLVSQNTGNPSDSLVLSNKLVDSTLMLHPKAPLDSRESIVQAYTNKNFKPRSISYGLTLFAGVILDGMACALKYMYKSESFAQALLVSKSEYVANRCNNLFRIPPISTLVGLFSSGEFFHGRATAVVPDQDYKDRAYQVDQILEGDVQDYTGSFLQCRDPLEHEILFSTYVRKNLVGLRFPDDMNLNKWSFKSNPLLKHAEEIRKNHQYSAEMLRGILQQHGNPSSSGESGLSLMSGTKNEGLAEKLAGLKGKLQLLKQKLGMLKDKLASLKNKLSFIDHPISSIWAINEGKCSRAEKLDAFIADCSTHKNLNSHIPVHQHGDGICRIATLNVHYWADPKNNGNFENIIKLIESINADVLILQEVSWDETYFLKKTAQELQAIFTSLGYSKQHFCKAATLFGAPFGNAIFSKYPLVPGKQVSLVKYNMIFNGEDRCYVGVAVQLPDAKTIDVYATHLDVFDESGATRLSQIKKLVTDIDSEGDQRNILIGADFNENRQKDYQYEVSGKLAWDLLVAEHKSRGIDPVPVAVSAHLESNGFSDCFSWAQISAPKFTVWTGTVVDFLYLKNWDLKIDGCYVWYDAASDHLPVIMDIKIPAQS